MTLEKQTTGSPLHCGLVIKYPMCYSKPHYRGRNLRVFFSGLLWKQHFKCFLLLYMMSQHTIIIQFFNWSSAPGSAWLRCHETTVTCPSARLVQLFDRCAQDCSFPFCISQRKCVSCSHIQKVTTVSTLLSSLPRAQRQVPPTANRLGAHSTCTSAGSHLLQCY